MVPINQNQANPLTRLVRAGALATTHHQDQAADQLAAAIDGFETVNMSHYAAAARLRRGRLIGGRRGRELVQQATTWMADQGVVCFDRMADVLAPGRWPSAAVDQ